MNNMLIGLGNCGSQIVKKAASSELLKDVKMYTIDSQVASVGLDTIDRITTIPIVADEKSGSGRNRDRGKALYVFHEEHGTFDSMYKDAVNSKAPVVVVSSAAGGTGSGSIVPLCKTLINKGVEVIPIIICPNMADPDAYHLNTSDLMIELGDVGVETYSTFRNTKGDADYTPINTDVVTLIEIIFGKKYDKTVRDSIDDSDMDVILNTPGRFIAISVTAPDVNSLKKELTRKVFSSYQPAWSEDESNNNTFMTAYSLKSMFADQDFSNVFEEINNRIVHVFDEYRNIVNDDNNGNAEATVVIAGLPRAEVKIIDNEYKVDNGISAGMNRSKRPSFMNRKKATVVNETDKVDGDDKSIISSFKWK